MNRPVVAEGLRELHAALDRVAGAELDTCGLRSALSEVARAEARLASLKLRLVAAAEASDVAAQDGSTDTAAWAAKAVGGNRPRAWGPVWLAPALPRTHQPPPPGPPP